MAADPRRRRQRGEAIEQAQSATFSEHSVQAADALDGAAAAPDVACARALVPLMGPPVFRKLKRL